MRWRRRAGSDAGVPPGAATAEESARRLAAEADALATAEPGSARALDAAARSVAAAEDLLRQADDVAALRRAAHAWWRQASTVGRAEPFPGQERGVVDSARRCAELGQAAIRRAPPADPAYGDVVADFALQLGVVVPALSLAGHGGEAVDLLEAAEAAVAGGAGAGIEHARARLTAFKLDALVSAASDAVLQSGRSDDLLRAVGDGLNEGLDDLLRAVGDGLNEGLAAMDILGRHLDDGPLAVIEAARNLQLVSRLLTILGGFAEAARVLDDAIGLAEIVSPAGPAYAAFLAGLEAERAGLRGHVTDDGAPSGATGGDDSGTGDLAADLDRSGRELGLEVGGGELGALSSAQAAVLVEQLRAREQSGPGAGAPQTGLAIAVQAWSLVREGRPAEAQPMAERSVAQLTRYADIGPPVRRALAVALTVLAEAADANHRADTARRALQQAELIRAHLPPDGQ
jgi:hypothetical protein